MFFKANSLLSCSALADIVVLVYSTVFFKANSLEWLERNDDGTNCCRKSNSVCVCMHMWFTCVCLCACGCMK